MQDVESYYFDSEILVTRLDESWTHHFHLELKKSFLMLDFNNGGTHQTFQKCLLDSSN